MAKKSASTHPTETLEWHEECLKNMQRNLESEEVVLNAQMKRVVEARQDITCLRNLLQGARFKGNTHLELGWRERNFKGRR